MDGGLAVVDRGFIFCLLQTGSGGNFESLLWRMEPAGCFLKLSLSRSGLQLPTKSPTHCFMTSMRSRRVHWLKLNEVQINALETLAMTLHRHCSCRSGDRTRVLWLQQITWSRHITPHFWQGSDLKTIARFSIRQPARLWPPIALLRAQNCRMTNGCSLP